jgi:death-on-curing protein
MKRDMAMAAATFWYEIIAQHPFLDGNKRTATEVMQFFLELNGFELKSPINGLIYISLKIANNDIRFNELDRWVYDKLLNQNDSTR